MHKILWIGCLALVGACRLDRLVESQAGRTLSVAPQRVTDSAAVGSAARRGATLQIAAVQGGPPGWTAHRTGTASWLSLTDTQGAAPGTLRLALDPAGLAPDTYRDTVVVSPSEGDGRPERVPVEFRIHPCSVTLLQLDSETVDSLGSADCAAPHRGGSYARLYSFSAGANDSVSFVVTAPSLDGYLVLGRSPDPDDPPLAAVDGCNGTSLDDPCLWYQRLPAGGTYFVELTTAAAGQTGGYTLRATSPRPPTAPESLAQFAGDSTTPLAAGASSGETEVVLAAVGHDPDGVDSLLVEAEVKPVGAAFDGQGIMAGTRVPNGARALVRVAGLSNNTAYHWRARIRDATGRRGPWQVFGENAETSPDFRVAVTATRLVYSQQPTTTAAGAAIAPAVQVQALDPDGNPATGFSGTVTIELETAPPGGTLSGTKSAPAVNGVATFADLSLNLAGGYRFLARAAGLSAVTSAPFTINPGPAAKLLFSVQPSNTEQNKPMTPPVQVRAEDLYGNLATGFTGGITVALGRDASPLGNARLSNGGPVGAAAGEATFSSLSIDQPGLGYTLTAAASGLEGATSASFDITLVSGTATRQSFTTEPGSVQAGQPITPSVQVTALDAQGQRVTTFRDNVRFDNLRITGTCALCQLAASASGLSGATSSSITVVLQ